MPEKRALGAKSQGVAVLLVLQGCGHAVPQSKENRSRLEADGEMLKVKG